MVAIFKNQEARTHHIYEHFILSSNIFLSERNGCQWRS